MKKILKGIGVFSLVLLNVTSLMAQGNGVAALEKANSEILSYIEPITNLFYVVCAGSGLQVVQILLKQLPLGLALVSLQ